MTNDHERGAVVLDLTGALAARADAPTDVDPYQTLAGGNGVLVSWEPAPTDSSRSTWGQLLPAATAFASQLSHIIERGGLQTAAGTGAKLFRVELPAGHVIQDLVPAIGGGFRGIAKTGGSSTITGQARLIPVGGAAAKAGGALALGPLVGVMALTVGAEMLARQQLEAKLDAILSAVQGISQHLEQQLEANLTTADEALQAATAALLDHAEIPEAVGLGSAITDLKQVKNQALGWLTKWEVIAESYGRKKGSVNFDDFRDDLGGVAIGGWDSLPSNIMLLYRALALDSRAQVISLAQTTLRRPDETFANFEQLVSNNLRANADAQERLQNLLWNFTTTKLSAGFSNVKPANWRQLGNVHTVVAELTRAITAAPPAPSLLTQDNRLLIEAVRQPDGQVAILQAPTGS